ncbi:MAG: hypothetical protein J1E38_03130 [Paramuribaculum sp.]|nr:hypothetical protein [Paramuribaculum sp.]
MKKLFYFAAGLLVMAGMAVSCTGTGSKADQEREDSIRRADSIAAVKDSIAKAEAAKLEAMRQDSIAKAENESKLVVEFLTDLYDNYLLSEKGRNPIKLKSHFSKSIQKRMKAAIMEEWPDCVGDQCYDFSILRGDSQDPFGKVTAITPLEDGWYEVDFTETGVKWKIKIKAEVENDFVSVTDITKAKPA